MPNFVQFHLASTGRASRASVAPRRILSRRASIPPQFTPHRRHFCSGPADSAARLVFASCLARLPDIHASPRCRENLPVRITVAAGKHFAGIRGARWRAGSNFHSHRLPDGLPMRSTMRRFERESSAFAAAGTGFFFHVRRPSARHQTRVNAWFQSFFRGRIVTCFMSDIEYS